MGNSSSSQSRKQEKYRHGPTVHQSRSFPNYSDDNSFLAPHTQGHQALSASAPPHIGSSHFAPPPYAALDDSTLGLGHTPPDKPLETESEYAFPSPSPRAQNLRTPMRAGTMEDALETLRKFNTIFIVDDSASMLTENRWGQARAALSGLANLAGQYDNDGIDIYFLNSSQVGRDLRDARQVVNLFNQIRIQPFAATPIGDKLEELLQEYMNKIESVAKNLPALRKIKPVNYIVLTDGSPSMYPALGPGRQD
ncbi:hypothetical protein H0H81_008864 [Sphagnurus paluster]|uniref:VWFA domain-containing protein n=1 Tax=Sphagnurus paluster TaxID=117069 RepID=A0A9P7K4J6_9AGAR|nr:hypothetical protein H0H81_008864 [Sphagnurus paluster]